MSVAAQLLINRNPDLKKRMHMWPSKPINTALVSISILLSSIWLLFSSLSYSFYGYHRHNHGCHDTIIVNVATYITAVAITIICGIMWRHDGHDDVSNHQPHDCLRNRSFRHRSKKTSRFRATGLCAGNSPVTGEFPAHMASNAENVPIWRRHHGVVIL